MIILLGLNTCDRYATIYVEKKDKTRRVFCNANLSIVKWGKIYVFSENF